MGVVTVDIAGQRYPIRSGLDERYITELAAFVDQKMRAALNAAPESDMLGLAILVGAQYRRRLFPSPAEPVIARGELNERALELERLVDDVLAQMTVKQAVNAS
jgi:hypothetical protein